MLCGGQAPQAGRGFQVGAWQSSSKLPWGESGTGPTSCCQRGWRWGPCPEAPRMCLSNFLLGGALWGSSDFQEGSVCGPCMLYAGTCPSSQGTLSKSPSSSESSTPPTTAAMAITHEHLVSLLKPSLLTRWGRENQNTPLAHASNLRPQVSKSSALTLNHILGH